MAIEGNGHDGESFSVYMARERDRLRAEREEIFNRQEELQAKLDGINREFAAIEAYEVAKTGKQAANWGSSSTRRPGPQTPRRRARRGSRQEELLTLIRQGNGLSRGEILERMGLKGDKSGEMSVSNALTALGKRNEVRREGGKYHPNV